MRYASIVNRLDTPAAYAWAIHGEARKRRDDGESFAWGLLDHGGVSLLPGTGFGASVTGHVRFSLTRPLAILQDACDRLERYARSLKTPSASA